MVNGVIAAQRVNSIYSNSFLRATSLPIGVSRVSGGCTNDGRLLTVGGDIGAGTRTNLCYIGTISSADPAKITWVQASSNYPTSMAAGASTFLPDGRIVVTGGYDGGYSTLVYFGTLGSAGTNTLNWAAGTSIPNQGRLQHTLNLLKDGRIILIGGYYWNGSSWSSLSDVYIGTVSGNSITWVQSTSLPESKSYHGACVLGNGKIVVTCGITGVWGNPVPEANHSNTVYIGTVSGNTITWVQSSNLNIVAYTAEAAVGSRNMVIALPGESGDKFLSLYGASRFISVGTVSQSGATITWNQRFKGILFRNTVNINGIDVLEFSKWPNFRSTTASINSVNRRIYLMGYNSDIPAPDYIKSPAPPGPNFTSSNYPDWDRSDGFLYPSSVLVSNRI